MYYVGCCLTKQKAVNGASCSLKLYAFGFESISVTVLSPWDCPRGKKCLSKCTLTHLCFGVMTHTALGLCDSMTATAGTKVLKGVKDFLMSLIASNMEVLDLMELFSCRPDET